MQQQDIALETMHASPSPPRVAIVLGAGKNGLQAAEALARQGVKVSVFERGSVPVHTTAGQLRALLRTSSIRVVGRVDVVEVLTTADGRTVRGVRLRLGGVHEAEFPADLVVDTMSGARVFDLPRGCAGYIRQVNGLPSVGIGSDRDEEVELAVAR